MPRPALSAISSAVLIGLLQVGSVAEAQPQSVTQVVMLGTGNPGPDPDRSGPATAIIVAIIDLQLLHRCCQRSQHRHKDGLERRVAFDYLACAGDVGRAQLLRQNMAERLQDPAHAILHGGDLRDDLSAHAR